MTNNRSYYIKTKNDKFIKLKLNEFYKYQQREIQNDIENNIYGKIFERLKDSEFKENRFKLFTKNVKSVEDPYMVITLSELNKYELFYAISGI